MCQNIEDFNRGCALIFARLYANFPNRVALHVEQLEKEPDDSTDSRVAIYGATVEFLADEGYLTFTGKAGPESARVFAGVRLASKGLAALNRVPQAIRPADKTLGDQMVEWGRGALSEIGKEAIKQSVAMVLGGA